MAPKRKAQQQKKGKDNRTPPFLRSNRVDHQEVLDRFAFAVQQYFDNNQDFRTREKVMGYVKRPDNNAKFHNVTIRQFDALLKELYEARLLALRRRKNPELAMKIEEACPIERVTVSGGTSRDAFFRIAGETLVFEIDRISKTKEHGDTLHIGIVSGSTTAGVLRKLNELDWRNHFGIEPREFPKVKVFALNVSLTGPDYLPYNSVILSQYLADKLNRECCECRAEAYGLNSQLIIDESRLAEVDGSPQIREVLEYTEPYRVNNQGSPNDTRLDIVLTGVGMMKRTESVFHSLVTSVDFLDPNNLATHRVVGDLAYTALSPDGQVVKLVGKNNGEDGASTTYMVYTVARINVLDAMASDPNKSVILVAQSTREKNKLPIIYASITGPRRGEEKSLPHHVSHLVVDEFTAKELVNYLYV